MKFISTRIFLVCISILSITDNIFSQVPGIFFTATNADSCAPFLNVEITSNCTNNPTSFIWDFGDGTAAFPTTNTVVYHNYANVGTYTVTLTATNANGSATDSIQNFITVYPNPVAYFTTDIDSACSNQTITFSDSTQSVYPIANYNWSWQDFTPPLNGPGLTVVTHGFLNDNPGLLDRTPQLLVTDVNGCIGSFDDVTLHIKPEANAAIGFGTVGSCTFPATVNFINSHPDPGPAIYNWNFGDPSSGTDDTSTAATPSHEYDASGTYTVTLTNGWYGCTVTDTEILNLAIPVAGISVGDTIACIGENFPFTNSSSPLPLSNMSFNWDFDDGDTSQAINPSHIFTTDGVYTVRLISTLGVCSDTTTRTIVVPAIPSAFFTSPDRQSCSVPFTVDFNPVASPNNIAWLWDFGDSGSSNNTSTANPAQHVYNNFGNYTVTLTVTDTFGCTNTLPIFNFVQIAPPVINFSPPDSGCVGEIFTYTASSSSPGDTIVNYNWNFGDGSPSQNTTSPSASHQFNVIGIYDVTLTVTTQSGCTATITNQGYARVGTKPAAVIDSIPQTICFQEEAIFQDLTAPPVTGWLWLFGDGESSTDRNPTHDYRYDTAGLPKSYEILLVAFYNGCSDTDTVINMITVLPPVPMFDTAMNCTNPYSVDFTNLSLQWDSLFWDFGDGSPIDSINENPTHVYPATGPYLVTLLATNTTTGCRVDTTMLINIVDLSAVATVDTNMVCAGNEINFFSLANSQDAASYMWTFGEGLPFVRDTSFTADTSHYYSTPGIYTVTLITTDIYGCTASDQLQVTINGPIAGFTSTPKGGCAPVEILFEDSSQTNGAPVSQWFWNFGTGGPIQNTSLDTISHDYINPGTYTVILTVVDTNNCQDSHTIPNFITASRPSAQINLTDPFGCIGIGDSITGIAGPLDQLSLPVDYIWNFGDGQFVTNNVADSISSVTHSYVANGQYTIWLKVADANGCMDSISETITIRTTQAHFTFSTSDLCFEENGILKAQINLTLHSDSNDLVTNWFWHAQVDSGTTSTEDAYFELNGPPGPYDLSLTVTNLYGCQSTYVIPDAITMPGPTGSFTFTPVTGCTPLTVNFTGTSTNSNIYAWDFGDGTVLNGVPDSVVTHIYNAPSTYTPQFYVGFPVQNQICYVPAPPAGEIVVTSLLGVNIIEDSIIITDGESDTLTVEVNNPAGAGPYTYNWNPASEITNQLTNFSTGASFLATTSGVTDYYYVEVPYGSAGCSGIDSVLVIYKICDALLEIPNVFTPDGNFQNDTYHIKDLCPFDEFKFRIYNRWGRIIFESDDPQFQWDGTTSSGSEASEGVYYYVLTLKTEELHGYIQLIRGEK